MQPSVGQTITGCGELVFVSLILLKSLSLLPVHATCVLYISFSLALIIPCLFVLAEASYTKHKREGKLCRRLSKGGGKTAAEFHRGRVKSSSSSVR